MQKHERACAIRTHGARRDGYLVIAELAFFFYDDEVCAPPYHGHTSGDSGHEV